MSGKMTDKQQGLATLGMLLFAIATKGDENDIECATKELVKLTAPKEFVEKYWDDMQSITKLFRDAL